MTNTSAAAQTRGAPSEARVRVLLASKFPERFIQETISPGLAEIGVDVVRIVGVDHAGPLRDVDAIAFMFQMCSHSQSNVFKKRAKEAGIPFLMLSRHSVEWPAAFRLLNIRLPPSRPAPVAATRADVVSIVEAPPRSFGMALRRARAREDVSIEFVADLCEVSPDIATRWETDAAPMTVDAYDKLCEIFPALSIAPSPEIARRGPSVLRFGAKEGELGDISPTSSKRVVELRPVTPPPPAPAPAPDPAPVVTPVVATPAPVVELPPAPPPPPAPSPTGLALDALLPGARALGLTGEGTLVFSENTARLTIGGEEWVGVTTAEAIATAALKISAKLDEQIARFQAARSTLR